MRYHLVSLALVLAALVLETLGFVSGATFVLFAGLSCEAAFWIRLVRARRPHVAPTHS
jgi:hypothetical protein